MQRLQENNLMFRCLKELLHHLSQCVEGVPSGSEQPSCARRGERLDSVIPRGGGSCRTPSVCLVSPAPRGAGARASPGLQEGDIVRRNILPQVQEAILVHQSSSCVPEPSPSPPSSRLRHLGSTLRGMPGSAMYPPWSARHRLSSAGRFSDVLWPCRKTAFSVCFHVCS